MATQDPRTIILKGRPQQEEAYAGGTFKPGHLIKQGSTDLLTVHATRGGVCEKLFAIENPATHTIDDAYTSTAPDYAKFCVADRGNLINAFLKAGESVVKGDPLMSYGDGTLCKAASAQLANVVADSTTITNTVTETTFSNGTVTIPANSLKAGDVIRMHGSIAVPSSNSTDTLTIKVYLGSTALITTAALNITNDDVMVFDVNITIRTIGASGTFVADALWNFGVAGTATRVSSQTGSTTVDTTAAVALTVKATFSVASTSNQVVLKQLCVDKLAAGPASGLSGSSGHVIAYARETKDYSAEVTDLRLKVRIA